MSEANRAQTFAEIITEDLVAEVGDSLTLARDQSDAEPEEVEPAGISLAELGVEPGALSVTARIELQAVDEDDAHKSDRR